MNILKLNKMCRVCLNINTNKKEKMQSVVDEIISLKLKLCGGIRSGDDTNTEYPNLICVNCCKNLDIAYNFRITCENSEKALKGLMIELQSASKSQKRLQIFDEFNSSNEQTFLHTRHSNLINIKDESVEDHIEDSGSLDKDIFLHDEYAEQNLDMFVGNGEHLNIEQEQQDEQEKSNTIRKYVKKNTFKVDDTLANTRVKRKYTKKSSITNIKLSKEDNKYVCEFCNSEYKGKSSFTYHMRRHTNELNYVCEICGTAFETNFKLKRHFLKHMGTLPYSCRSCDMKFSSSSNRDRHERRLHTTIRPFQCAYCEKAFSYSDQLKNHIRVHTGEKPYVCEKCGSAFKRKSHLSAHSNALTPCVIKMTLKNTIYGEKAKLQKLANKNNAIKNKISKSAHRKTMSNSESINHHTATEASSTDQVNQPIIETNKLSKNYVNVNVTYLSADIATKKNVNESSTGGFESEEQLNFYNLGNERNDIILEQNTFIKKELSK